MLPLLPILGALASAGTSIWDSIASKRNATTQNQLNRDQANLAYQKNLDSWNLQNAYNTPQAQMDRFKKAGLNPNLIYTRGDSGNAGSISAYQAPTMSYNFKAPELGGVLNTYSNLRTQQLNQQLLKQQKFANKIRNQYLPSMAQNDYEISMSKVSSANSQSNIDYWNGLKALTNSTIFNDLLAKENPIVRKEFMSTLQQQIDQAQNSSNQAGISGWNLQNQPTIFDQYQNTLAQAKIDLYMKEFEKTMLNGTGFKSAKDILPLLMMFLTHLNGK